MQRDYISYGEAMTADAYDNKQFWRLINLRRNKRRIPSYVTLNDSHASGSDRATLFNNYFQSNFANHNLDFRDVQQVISYTQCRN